MNRTQKEQVVDALSEKLGQAEAVFLADFQGLKVDKITDLRRRVREAGGEFEVAKNTLVKLAVKGTGNECLNEQLAGNNALGTTAEDPAALAKTLVNFAKDNDKLVIKGGAMGGKPLSFEQVKAMADLPSREVLLATMLGAMNAVPGGFVRVLAAVPQNLMYALAAIRDQKEAQA